jgi:hypothetical protein
MTERFTVDYDITVGNYCLHDECEAKGVDGYIAYLSDEEQANLICDKLNEQDETIKKQNQEILSCHDTLVTIEELCDAVLNHDFKNVTDKVDFCHMLNEMDNKDLMFLKECFEAIRDNDLKTMTSLTLECKYGGDVDD